jgi:hypothetical protein
MGSNPLRPFDIVKRQEYLHESIVYLLNHYNDHVRG